MILTSLDKKLLTSGFDSFDIEEKNRLVSQIASKENKPFFEVSTDCILNHHKYLKKNIINETCEEKIIQGFVHNNGHQYRMNRDDQMNFIGKYIWLSDDEEILKVVWKTEDVGYIEHSREEWLDIFKKGMIYKETILFKYNTLKYRIGLATTDKEVLAITWDEGEEV